MNPQLLVAFCIVLIPASAIRAQEFELHSRPAINTIREFKKSTLRLNREYLKEREKLDAKYLAKLDSNKSGVVAALQTALEQEAKKVNLKEANRINDALTAHKNRASVLPNPTAGSRIRHEDLTALPSTMVGDWVGKWGTTGNPFEFHLSGDSDSQYGPITFQGQRVLLLERQSEYVELIPYNGNLIVLGYSRSKRKHPNKTLPNHVGLASRVK